VLAADHLPELGADLVAALAGLDVQDLPHLGRLGCLWDGLACGTTTISIGFSGCSWAGLVCGTMGREAGGGERRERGRVGREGGIVGASICRVSRERLDPSWGALQLRLDQLFH
jgi:hypothetical protein